MPLPPREVKKRYSDKWRAQGFTQVAFWVPVAEVENIRSIIKRIKDDYISRDAECGAENNADNG